MSDKKPAIPSNFPSDLKELVIQGWSKDQKERPPIEDFKSALNKMLTCEGKDQCLTLLEDNKYPKEKEEQQLDFHKEVNSAEKTEEELSTTTKAGNPIKLFLQGIFNNKLYIICSQFFEFCIKKMNIHLSML
jgi:hypothetical protein